MTDKHILRNSGLDADLYNMFQRALILIDSYRYFKPGWDGYHGKTLDPVIVDFAIDYIKCLTKFKGITEINPCPRADGCIDIEFFKDGKRVYATFEMSESE